MPSVQASHQKNLELCRRPGWADEMIADIQKKKCDTVRIHVAGDFFGMSYIRDWIKIVQACPDTVFYAYTRSWRTEALTAGLIELGELPNMQLWWSVDKETGQGPVHARIKQAYLATNDDDKPTFDADLIFREKQDTVIKRVNSVPVCPYEIGVATTVTCQSCRICYKEATPLISIGEGPKDGPYVSR